MDTSNNQSPLDFFKSQPDIVDDLVSLGGDANDGTTTMIKLRRPKIMNSPWRRTVCEVPSKFQFWFQQFICRGSNGNQADQWDAKRWLSMNRPMNEGAQQSIVSEMESINSGDCIDVSVMSNNFGIDPFLLSNFTTQQRLSSSNDVNNNNNFIQSSSSMIIDSSHHTSPLWGLNASKCHDAFSSSKYKQAPQRNNNNNNNSSSTYKKFEQKPFFPCLASLVGVFPDGTSLTVNIFDFPNWLEFGFTTPDDPAIFETLLSSITDDQICQAIDSFNMTHCNPIIARAAKLCRVRDDEALKRFNDRKGKKTTTTSSCDIGNAMDEDISYLDFVHDLKSSDEEYKSILNEFILSNRSSAKFNFTPPILRFSRVRLYQTCGFVPDPNDPYIAKKDDLLRIEFQSTDRKYIDMVQEHFESSIMGIVIQNHKKVKYDSEIRFMQFMIARGFVFAPEMWITLDRWIEATSYATTSQVEVYASVFDLVPSLNQDNFDSIKTMEQLLVKADQMSLKGYSVHHNPHVKPLPMPKLMPARPVARVEASFDVEQCSNLGDDTSFPDGNRPNDCIICINANVSRSESSSSAYASVSRTVDTPSKYTFINSEDSYNSWKTKKLSESSPFSSTPNNATTSSNSTLRKKNDLLNTYFVFNDDGLVPDWLHDHPQIEQMRRFEQKTWMNAKFSVGRDRLNDLIGEDGSSITIKTQKDVCQTPTVMNRCKRIMRMSFFFDHLAISKTTTTTVNSPPAKVHIPSPVCILIPTLYKDDSIGLMVTIFPTEYQMLISFRDFLVDVQPELLIGHNTSGYDWRALYTRANFTSKDCQPYDDKSILDRNPDGSYIIPKSLHNGWMHLPALHSSIPGARFKWPNDIPAAKTAWNYSSKFIFMKTPFVRVVIKTKAKSIEHYYPKFIGFNDCDTMQFFQTAYGSVYEVFKLTVLSQKRLKDEKVDLTIPQMGRCYKNGFYRPIAVYCDYDCILPAALAIHADMQITQSCQAKGNFMSLEQMMKEGAMSRFMRIITVVGHRLGYRLETSIPVSPKTKLGGFVFPGLASFRPVPVPTNDFKGHYTSAMVAYNLCMSTYIVPFDERTKRPLKLSEDYETLSAQIRHFTQVTLPNVYGKCTKPKYLAPFTEDEILKNSISDLDVKKRLRLSNDFDLLQPRSSQCSLFLNPNRDQQNYAGLAIGEVCPVANFTFYKPDMYMSGDQTEETISDKQIPCRGINHRGITAIVIADLIVERSLIRRGQAALMKEKTNYSFETEKWINPIAETDYKNKEANQIGVKLKGNAVYGAYGGKGDLYFGYMPNSVTLVCRVLTKYVAYITMTRYFPSKALYEEMMMYRMIAVENRRLFRPGSKLREFAEILAIKQIPQNNEDIDQIDEPLCKCENDLDVRNSKVESKADMSVIYGDTDSFMNELLILPDPREGLTEEEIKRMLDPTNIIDPNDPIYLRVLKLDFNRRKLAIAIGGESAKYSNMCFRACGLTVVEIEFEKCLYPFYSKEQMKNYAGGFWENPEAMKYVMKKGGGSKRDVIAFVRQLEECCIQTIMDTHSEYALEKMIHDVLNELLSTRGVIRDVKSVSRFCMSQGLNSISYAGTRPGHVVANDRLKASFPGSEFKVGNRFHLFPLDTPDQVKQSQHMMTLEQFKLMITNVKPYQKKLDVLQMLENADADDDDDDDSNCIVLKSKRMNVSGSGTNDSESVGKSSSTQTRSQTSSSSSSSATPLMDSLISKLSEINIVDEFDTSGDDENMDALLSETTLLEIEDDDGANIGDQCDIASSSSALSTLIPSTISKTNTIKKAVVIEDDSFGNVVVAKNDKDDQGIVDFIESADEFLAYDDNDDGKTTPLLLCRKKDFKDGGRRQSHKTYFVLDLCNILKKCKTPVMSYMILMHAKKGHVNGSLDYLGENIIQKFMTRAETMLRKMRGYDVILKRTPIASKASKQLVKGSGGGSIYVPKPVIQPLISFKTKTNSDGTIVPLSNSMDIDKPIQMTSSSSSLKKHGSYAAAPAAKKKMIQPKISFGSAANNPLPQ